MGSAILSVFATVSVFLAFLEYAFSWRKDIEFAIGPWSLGLLEGIILATIVVLIAYVIGPSIIAILNGLKEIGNRQKC